MAGRRRRLADLVPLREALQGMYACPDDYNAYMVHNEAFHLGIAKIAGNEVLRATLQCLLVLLRPVVNECQPHTWKEKGCQKRERDAREHEAIFQALLAGDAETARTAMAAHLQDTEASLKLALGQGSNGTASTVQSALP
jgi:GntR family transcriptional repressor for pyruvate dehydrogenase complex